MGEKKIGPFEINQPLSTGDESLPQRKPYRFTNKGKDGVENLGRDIGNGAGAVGIGHHCRVKRRACQKKK